MYPHNLRNNHYPSQNYPSYYYKYNFISPEQLVTRVKEELKSYFDTGAVDDLLFPLWIQDALRKLGKSSLPIGETLIFLDDFKATLPPDFDSVREAWMCTQSLPTTIRVPGSYYTQVTTRIDVPENNPQMVNRCAPCDSCPTEMKFIYKTNTDQTITTSHVVLLRPGNISTLSMCSTDCPNRGSQSANTFDIHGNKFTTNFRTGDVYLVYYSREQDPSGYQLIPENYRIEEYIRAFLKFKVFEQLWNQITDETFNQIQTKYEVYSNRLDEAFVMADLEIKKQTINEKMMGFRRDRHRLDAYNIR